MRSTKASTMKTTSMIKSARNKRRRAAPPSGRLISKSDISAGMQKRYNIRLAGKTPDLRASNHKGKAMINNSKIGLLIKYSDTNWRVGNTGFTYFGA
jgi:hypothetical protein